MGSEAVRVIVRCRPMNEREEKLNCEVVLAMDTSIAQVQLRRPKNKQAPPKLFTFDGVYYMEDTTQQIYEDICFPLVEGVLQGFNGTVFAYGQTGCGKSYTMMGVEDPPENKGVIPRAFDHVFDQAAVVEGVKYVIQASYLEIYNEEVRDLLGRDSKKKLDLHEHPDKGVYVQGLSHHKVLNVHDLERVMELGSKNRSVGATLMNVDSSRSHSIFTINIEMIEVSEGRLRCGRLNLVDLAGSERQSKTGSTGERLKEATKINLSLSALGNVISALVDGRSTHIPYRDSKLTRLLQSSLGGNTKTLMVACVSPADNNFDETLSTLRYANRAKNIKNKPRINEDPKDALLREYREEIDRLKQLLLGRGDVPQEPSAPSPPPPQHPTAAQLQALEDDREAIRREYEARIAELREQFSKEQSDRAGLQEELGKLQKAFDEQLAAAQERHIHPGETSQTPGDVTTPSTLAPALATAGALPSHSQSVPGGGGGAGDEDREILRQHEQALQRLEELQKGMIGGERAGDEGLRQRLQQRRRRADARLEALRHASSELEDDGIIERIFNSLTDEVRVKSKLLERSQAKLKSAEEDNKDLSAEFEMDRQDYLDTIRRQERTIKLQEQLLATIVPCLRRDCNYYNLDKIRLECKYDEDQLEWILPKLTVARTSLAHVDSGSIRALSEQRSASTSKLPRHRSGYNEMQVKSPPSVAPNPPPPMTSNPLLPSHIQASVYDPPESDKYLNHLHRSTESDYFKPKRAQELLAHSAQMKAGGTLEQRDGLRRGSDSLQTTVTANAAAIHGVGTRIIGDSSYSRKPGKLESLSVNPTLPQNFTPIANSHILDKVEKRLSNRRKSSLEPLKNKRKPPL